MSEFRSSTRTLSVIEVGLTVAAIFFMALALLPVLTSARAAARVDTCMDNLKELPRATLGYVADFDDRYPQIGPSVAHPDKLNVDLRIVRSGTQTTFDLIRPYTHGDGREVCGEDTDPSGKDCLSSPIHLNSYVSNAAINFGLRISDISESKPFVMFAERRTDYEAHGPYCSDVYHPWFNIRNRRAERNEMHWARGAIAPNRHKEKACFGLSDGSVRWCNFEALFDLEKNINLHQP